MFYFINAREAMGYNYSDNKSWKKEYSTKISTKIADILKKYHNICISFDTNEILDDIELVEYSKNIFNQILKINTRSECLFFYLNFFDKSIIEQNTYDYIFEDAGFHGYYDNVKLIIDNTTTNWLDKILYQCHLCYSRSEYDHNNFGSNKNKEAYVKLIGLIINRKKQLNHHTNIYENILKYEKDTNLIKIILPEYEKEQKLKEYISKITT